MQQTPLPTDSMPIRAAAGRRSERFIYIACPWSPAGGGMFKVADYLIQAQAAHTPEQAALLRPLDTRGGGSALASSWMLLTALAKLVRGRLAGSLAGVHVNTAERLSLVRKGTVVVACRALGIPVVIHLHAQMRRFYQSLPSPLKRLTRWMFSLASTVVVIGSTGRRFVMDELRVPANRIEIVFNGVPGPEQPRAPRLADEVRRVAFVGRLCEPKGVSDLLLALARPGLDSARLEVVLAGSGDIEGYEAKARSLGIDHFVRFAGWCDQAQIDELLAKSDVLVLPSHDEVLPLVVLEALANGVAVVCTPVGELPVVLTEGVNACFAEPGDVDGLAATLQNVLSQPELLARLGRNGRALYEQQFSLSRFFANVARIHRRHFGVAGHVDSHAGHEAAQ
jgi:glycosyltransferase involved in cell wall biosynthesis